MWDILKVKKAGLFAGGVLFGTAGVKLLSSKDAKKFYTNCTAAVLRAKDSLMKTATTVQENAGDILAEAQQINEERAAKEAAEEAAKKAAQEATKKATKENAVKMIKAGKLSIEDIPQFFTSLTPEDIKEIENELMQTL